MKFMHSTFLALGDSYTIGEGVPGDGNWPSQLVARLRTEGNDVDGPRILATTGWTTDELAAAMDAAAFERPYALVSLSIGVNNQYRGRPLGEYRVQFHRLLRRAIALAGEEAARVMVVSIPDWGTTPFAAHEGRDAAAMARAIDGFNAVARGEVTRTGARWVDVTTISRRPDSRGELVDDGLHPSSAQYARWVEAILPVARAALRGG
jgi:lysophospholipase L1-like esterase